MTNPVETGYAVGVIIGALIVLVSILKKCTMKGNSK